ncbi:thioredoxin [Brooklawnia cerclae]|uniref:Thioredoxin n=1 Tax=Brooklawnia cerclae TaxID=349934 RepID=A0ABX0SJS7_9ACTN|nr:thioredoxin [Brooklawnia cerclae]NIH58682.1 thioredoxin 1 [Brooklawnia cerclae]
MAVIEVTDTTFEQEVLKATKPVLVDYWADWCSPCKQLSPIVDELSETYGDRMVFAKLDTNTNPDVPMKQGVMALPTLQFFVNGEVVSALQGGKTKAALVKAIESVL